MKWLLWPGGSWHLHDHTTGYGWLMLLCGRGLNPSRKPEWSDTPLPDGKTCETCLRVDRSRVERGT